MAVILTHKELRVYQQARELSQKVYQLTRGFPKHEIFNLTSQILRSSRSVRGNIAEAWQRRRYKASFVAKLNDAETEAAKQENGLSPPRTAAISAQRTPRFGSGPTKG